MACVVLLGDVLRLGYYLCVGRAGESEREGLRSWGGLDPSRYPLPAEPRMAQYSGKSIKMASSMLQKAPRPLGD
eukprot:4394830-Pyramimonas_sp.AAC.1